MRYTTELLLSLLLMLFLSACKRNRTIQQGSNGEFAKYAQLIACADSQGHSVFMVSDPWRTGHRLQRFVLEKPFSEIWGNPPAGSLLDLMRHKKEHVKGRCRTCRWLDICGGNFRARGEAVTGDIWGEDPTCYVS